MGEFIYTEHPEGVPYRCSILLNLRRKRTTHHQKRCFWSPSLCFAQGGKASHQLTLTIKNRSAIANYIAVADPFLFSIQYYLLSIILLAFGIWHLHLPLSICHFPFAISHLQLAVFYNADRRSRHSSLLTPHS